MPNFVNLDKLAKFNGQYNEWVAQKDQMLTTR